MTVWVTSDLHFYHKNIIKYSPNTRPYSDVNEMNESMQIEWNTKVHPNDTVYILGDVAFSNAQQAASILCRLNGRKILIKGNHDSKLVKQPDFCQFFEDIHDYFVLSYEGFRVIMFHFPIIEWDQCHRGSILLHGHLHGNPSGLEKFRAFDVGVDATGEVVVKLDDIIELALTRELFKHGIGEQ